MRFLIAGLLLFVLLNSACYAQTAKSNKAAARAAIGRDLADDTDMYDRYVYDDAQTVGKQVPVSLPVMPDADIQSWLTDHIAQIMTVTPTTYPEHKKKVIDYFVPAGWTQLESQWLQAQIPQLIRDQKYTMDAVIIDTPRIVAKGRQNTAEGTYRWITDVPIILTYTDPTQKAQSFKMSLRIGVSRIPMKDNAQLIAIDQWGVTPVAPPTTEPIETP